MLWLPSAWGAFRVEVEGVLGLVLACQVFLVVVTTVEELLADGALQVRGTVAFFLVAPTVVLVQKPLAAPPALVRHTCTKEIVRQTHFSTFEIVSHTIYHLNMPDQVENIPKPFCL